MKEFLCVGAPSYIPVYLHIYLLYILFLYQNNTINTTYNILIYDTYIHIYDIRMSMYI